MSVIGKSHPIAPATIITITGMDKSSVSRQLRLLKEAGYIEASPTRTTGEPISTRRHAEAGARFEAIRAANRARFGRCSTPGTSTRWWRSPALLDKFIGRDA